MNGRSFNQEYRFLIRIIFVFCLLSMMLFPVLTFGKHPERANGHVSTGDPTGGQRIVEEIYSGGGYGNTYEISGINTTDSINNNFIQLEYSAFYFTLVIIMEIEPDYFKPNLSDTNFGIDLITIGVAK